MVDLIEESWGLLSSRFTDTVTNVVHSISWHDLLWWELYRTSASSTGLRMGVISQGRRGYALSPRKKPSFGSQIPSWLIWQFVQIKASGVDPGQRATRFKNYFSLEQIPWTFIACDILRLTYASSFICGRMIGIRLPSTHPNTLGTLRLGW
jgi:hypothetical protein